MKWRNSHNFFRKTDDIVTRLYYQFHRLLLLYSGIHVKFLDLED